jgi:hypothetical protein
VPFNPIFSAAVQCNTAWEFTYDDSGCANYMAQGEYMSKDENDLTASAALFYFCLLHIDKYPSIAPDTGTDTRTAKHFAQRVLNSAHGKIEIGAQMAAHALLGHEGFMSSEKFWYTHIYPAIKFVRDNNSDYGAFEDDRDEEDTDDEENSDDTTGTNSDEENSSDTSGSNTDGSDCVEEPNPARDYFDSENCDGDVDDGSELGEHDHAIPGAMSYATNGIPDDDDSHVELSPNFDTNEKREVLSGHGDNTIDELYDGDDESEEDNSTRHAIDRYAHIRDNGLFSDDMELEEVERAQDLRQGRACPGRPPPPPPV